MQQNHIKINHISAGGVIHRIHNGQMEVVICGRKSNDNEVHHTILRHGVPELRNPRVRTKTQEGLSFPLQHRLSSTGMTGLIKII